MREFPTNHQELFDFAINAQLTVISNRLSKPDNFELHKWAVEYSNRYSLNVSSDYHDFNIYYVDDEDVKEYPTLRLLNLIEIGYNEDL